MSIEEFVREEQRRLEIFKRQWIARHNNTPDEYPLEMEPGEWDEQLSMWDEDFAA